MVVMARLVMLVFLTAELACTQNGTNQAPPAVERAPRQERERPASANGIPNDFRNAVSEVARRTLPGVVAINTERTVPAPVFPFGNGGGSPFDFFFGPREERQQQERRQTGLGSGVIVSSDGYILTNNHVIEDADRIEVRLQDGRRFDARVIGRDPATEVAVLKIDVEGVELPTVPIGDSDAIEVGDWVVAIGSPFGLYQTVTQGIVSAKQRRETGIATYGNFIQTDAAINPGNSGGALVDLDGRLVGINTAIFTQSGGYQGIGFAIPINLARTVMRQLIEDGAVTRGWLGVSIQSIDQLMSEALGIEDSRGAMVSGVESGSPAAQAGLRRGDAILSMADEPIQDANDLMNRVAMLRPGTTVPFIVLREGRERRIEVTVAQRAENQTPAPTRQITPNHTPTQLGLQVTELNTRTRRQYSVPGTVDGLVVAGVTPATPASEAGLRVGDVIMEVDYNRVTRSQQLRRALQRGDKDTRPRLLLIWREGSTLFTAIRPV